MLWLEVVYLFMYGKIFCLAGRKYTQKMGPNLPVLCVDFNIGALTGLLVTWTNVLQIMKCVCYAGLFYDLLHS